jgi:hypothetical protein
LNARSVSRHATMARRPYDRAGDHRRGNEPLEHVIWKARVRRLVNVLRDTGPLDAAAITQVMLERKLWNETYTKNVLAAADLTKAVRYRVIKRPVDEEEPETGVWEVAS